MKLLAIISLTAFLCYGVQSSGLSERELNKRIVNSGIAVFIDFLDKVKNATEKIVKDEHFKKSRIVVQEHLKDLRQTAKQISEEAKDDSQRVKRIMLAVSAAVSSGTMIREIAGKYFHPFMNVYRENFKTETMTGIWREVESEYLKGAPPINNKPMGFLSYLLAKMVVRSGLVNALKGGVDIALEVGKIDLNQLHEEAQMFINHIREKAIEISAWERQKETNDFLASLRTASGLTVYYWDQLLEHTERLSFQEKHYDSMKRWGELTMLRNASEKYHVLINPETRDDILNWIDKTFGKFSEAMALKYYTVGNEVFGSDRFNQSNWAILKIATVYGLPVYEKLTESGFGISELNSLLNRVDLAIIILEGNDESSLRQTFTEHLTLNIMLVITYFAEKEKEKGIDETLLPFM
ncbi:uncharacterized protein LOC130567307 [Triplophysa rosa]|uniref:uncharacterized protein LOC130567307 n=1 Tax=Triplophysa rosa TaxID=992332 RepID=UPI002546119A|nr:uncharacterized protein LOC130567307 [Triplophysa rosa]